MSKAPIILIGGAAVIGLAVAASRNASGTTAAPATPGKTAKDMTDAQKDKVAKWAKEKGIPLEQAWDLAKSVYSGVKF
jgi:hypothetical protein